MRVEGKEGLHLGCLRGIEEGEKGVGVHYCKVSECGLSLHLGGSPMVSISRVWPMTWQSGTIEEARDVIRWMGC